MAQLNLRLPENAAGEFYVDSTCIDCDTCRQLEPEVFAQSARAQSFVSRQPRSGSERRRALLALVACPTASIGGAKGAEVRAAMDAFPLIVDGPVRYCGFTAESSFGASSYLVLRESGNALVDSPRAAAPLLRRIDELGGVRTLFLTHRDDVADHERIRERFGCERVMHRLDARGLGVERALDGEEPVELGPGLLAIPVPGHTRGSCALLVDETYLFTGDHLWAEDDGRLGASRSVCWYSWDAQLRSLEKLQQFRFRWVLPGHGRRFVAQSPAAMHAELRDLLTRVNRS